MDVAALWNTLLTVGLGLFGFLARELWMEIKRLSILLNRTREETAKEFALVAKEYVTKGEVHAEVNRVIQRLEALDTKLDRLMEQRK